MEPRSVIQVNVSNACFGKKCKLALILAGVFYTSGSGIVDANEMGIQQEVLL